MRALVITNKPAVGQQVRGVLSRSAIECAATDVVCGDVAAERASRIAPQIAVYFLEDDRRRSFDVLRQMSRIAGCHLFVVGTANDPQLILRCLREGASEFVDQEHLENHLEDAIVRYRSRTARKTTTSTAGRVIGVVAPAVVVDPAQWRSTWLQHWQTNTRPLG